MTHAFAVSDQSVERVSSRKVGLWVRREVRVLRSGGLRRKRTGRSDETRREGVVLAGLAREWPRYEARAIANTSSYEPVQRGGEREFRPARRTAECC